MIKPILDLFKIHRKVIFGNSPIIIQDMFSKTPKPFNAVNVILGTFVDQVFVVRDFVMLATTFERIVASESVGKIDGTFSGFLSDDVHQFRSRHALNHPRINPAVALQKAKNNAFALSASSSLTFPFAAKVALVQFNLAGKLATLEFGRVINQLSHFLVNAGNGLIINLKIVREFVSRLDLVESLDDFNLSSELFYALLPTALPAFNVSSLRPINFERTAKNTLPTPQKVGRTTENVLLPCNHMDIFSSVGYDYH